MKDVATLEAAYNDSAGISAAFNLNMLSVLNARLDADFDIGAVRACGRFNPQTEQMEMFLRPPGLKWYGWSCSTSKSVSSRGEMLHTEISAKFRRWGLESELIGPPGLEPELWWTDAGGSLPSAFPVNLIRARNED